MTAVATVPVGNQHRAEPFGPCAGRSDFQVQRITAISQDENFNFFCGNPRCDEPYHGVTHVLYVTKDRALHMQKLGVKRVLRHLVCGDDGKSVDVPVG